MHARWSLCLPAVTCRVTLRPFLSHHFLIGLLFFLLVLCIFVVLPVFSSPSRVHLASRLSSYKVIIFSIIGALLLCMWWGRSPPQASSELLFLLPQYSYISVVFIHLFHSFPGCFISSYSILQQFRTYSLKSGAY